MKKVKLSIKVLLMMALVGTMVTGCAGSNENSQETSAAEDGKPIVAEICILNGMAPYTFVDENGENAGYDYECLKMIDELVPEYEFNYNMIDADAGAVGVQSGKYALSCSAHFPTPARKEQFILSDPNGYFPVNLISRPEDKIDSFEQLDGKVLVPNPPSDGLSVALLEVAEQYPDVEYIQEPVSNYIPYVEGLKGIVEGRWDCWFGSESMMNSVLEKEPMDLYCSEPVGCAALVMCINKDQTDLRDKINAALAILREDGSLSELSIKWLGEDTFAIKDKLDKMATEAGIE
jgi:L-cystine transport system substrate-binding protein